MSKSADFTQNKFFWLGLAVLAGFLLRFCNLLQDKSYWGDEFFTVNLIQQPLSRTLQFILADVHAPLYYFIERIWLGFFGVGSVSARFLSFAASIATIPAIYAMTRSLAGERPANLAAFLVAVSPYHLQMANEAREYAWAAFVGTMLTLSFLRLKPAGDRSFRFWSVLSLYLHHYFWPMLTFLFFSLKSFIPKFSNRIRFFLPVIAIGMPMFFVVIYQMMFSEYAFDHNRISESFSLLGIIKKWFGLIIHFSSGYYIAHVSIDDVRDIFQRDWLAATVLVASILLSLSAWLSAFLNKRKSGTRILSVAMIGFVVLVAGLTFVYPIRATARYFACFSSLFFAVVAYGFYTMPRVLRNLFIGCWFLLNLFVSVYSVFYLKTDPIHREDYKALTHYLLEQSTPADLIIGTRPSINHYLQEWNIILPARHIDDQTETVRLALNQNKYTDIWIAFYGDKEERKNESYRQTMRDLLRLYGYVDSGEVKRFGGPLGFNYLYRFSFAADAAGSV